MIFLKNIIIELRGYADNKKVMQSIGWFPK